MGIGAMHGGLWGQCWFDPLSYFHDSTSTCRPTHSFYPRSPSQSLAFHHRRFPAGVLLFTPNSTLIGDQLLQQLNMEATAALGIAGNIVQFIDFSQKFCRAVFQIYHLATGATKHNDAVETLIDNFTSSLDTLSADLSKYCAHLSSAVPGGASSNNHVGDQMQALVENCREVAVELQRRLDSVKMKGQQAGKRKAILVAVKAMWKEKEFQDLEQTLSAFRKELQWIVLVSLRLVT